MPPAPRQHNLATHIFQVVIPGIDTIGMFKECEGLEVEIEVLEYAEGGNYEFVHKFPGRARYPNLRLSRGLTKEDNFLKWLMATKTQAERKEVTIKLLEGRGQVARQWTFADAFPVRWTGPNLSAGSAAAADESLEIAHSGLKLV